MSEALIEMIPQIIGRWPHESLVLVGDDGRSVARLDMPLTAAEYHITLEHIGATFLRWAYDAPEGGTVPGLLAVVAFTEFTQQARDIVGLMDTQMNVRSRLALRTDAGRWAPLMDDGVGQPLHVSPIDFEEL